MAVAAILHERRLQRRFDPRDLRQINVAPQRAARRGLEVKLFDLLAADDDDPGLFRVRCVDKHLVCHETEPSDAQHQYQAQRQRR
jgi:hypothetical protein